jgi:hypothetical protein
MSAAVRLSHFGPTSCGALSDLLRCRPIWHLNLRQRPLNDSKRARALVRAVPIVTRRVWAIVLTDMSESVPQFWPPNPKPPIVQTWSNIYLPNGTPKNHSFRHEVTRLRSALQQGLHALESDPLESKSRCCWFSGEKGDPRQPSDPENLVIYNVRRSEYEPWQVVTPDAPVLRFFWDEVDPSTPEAQKWRKPENWDGPAHLREANYCYRYWTEHKDDYQPGPRRLGKSDSVRRLLWIPLRLRRKLWIAKQQGFGGASDQSSIG